MSDTPQDSRAELEKQIRKQGTVRAGKVTISRKLYSNGTASPLESENQDIVEIGIDDLMSIVDTYAAEQVAAVERKHKQTHVCWEKQKPNPYRHNHVCTSCSEDGINPGVGCINCRNTGMEQMPCVLFDKCPGSTLTKDKGEK